MAYAVEANPYKHGESASGRFPSSEQMPCGWYQRWRAPPALFYVQFRRHQAVAPGRIPPSFRKQSSEQTKLPFPVSRKDTYILRRSKRHHDPESPAAWSAPAASLPSAPCVENVIRAERWPAASPGVSPSSSTTSVPEPRVRIVGGLSTATWMLRRTNYVSDS